MLKSQRHGRLQTAAHAAGASTARTRAAVQGLLGQKNSLGGTRLRIRLLGGIKTTMTTIRLLGGIKTTTTTTKTAYAACTR